MELVVVDAASKDGSCALLREAAGKLPLKLIERTDRSQVAACNAGLAAGAHSRVLLMRPDVLVGPGLLSQANETSEDHVVTLGPVKGLLLRPGEQAALAAGAWQTFLELGEAGVQRVWQALTADASTEPQTWARLLEKASYARPPLWISTAEVQEKPVHALRWAAADAGNILLSRTRVLEEGGLDGARFDDLRVAWVDLLFRLCRRGVTVRVNPTQAAYQQDARPPTVDRGLASGLSALAEKHCHLGVSALLLLARRRLSLVEGVRLLHEAEQAEAHGHLEVTRELERLFREKTRLYASTRAQ